MLEQSFHKSPSWEISSGGTHAFFEIAGADYALLPMVTIKAADEGYRRVIFMRSIQE